ncbi:hypothetical protein BSKO_03376 [Bryopsis sp. KO-2023]|nr:hypothetical protein BSKO_03376 [Bryopsis sp. KO-2023]
MASSMKQRLAIAIFIFCCLGLSPVVEAQIRETVKKEPVKETTRVKKAKAKKEPAIVITIGDVAPSAEEEEDDDEDVAAVEDVRSEPREYIIGGDIGWTVQAYEDITDAIVGDILVFVYQPFHTVWEVPERTCNFEEGTELAGLTDSPFKLELEEPGTIHISDDGSGRCESGKLFSVTVSEAP